MNALSYLTHAVSPLLLCGLGEAPQTEDHDAILCVERGPEDAKAPGEHGGQTNPSGYQDLQALMPMFAEKLGLDGPPASAPRRSLVPDRLWSLLSCAQEEPPAQDDTPSQ